MSLLSLNPQQVEVATSRAGHIMCVAGPGSGKTRTLTSRIPWLISNDVAPQNILAVTFTTKAANELKERLKVLNVEGVHASTLHSFSLDVIKTTLDTPPTVLDEKVAKQIFMDANPEFDALQVKEAWKRLGLTRANNHPLNTLLDPEYRAYKAALDKLGATDFDGLIETAISLIQNLPEYSWVNNLQHLLIDEFQDLSLQQYELVKQLGLVTGANILVVGDPDQSIYAFRGADTHIFTRFETDFPDTQIIELGENYRSTKRIVETAVNLIQHNPSDIRANLHTANDTGTNVVLHVSSQDVTEAWFIRDTIQELLAAGESLQEIVVLVRFKQQKHVIKKVLEEAGLDVEIMTIHATKGLEFDHVFIPGFEDGIYPKEADEASVREERRILYVACTRARKSLYLSRVVVRRMNGQHVTYDKSPFIHELPAENFDLKFAH